MYAHMTMILKRKIEPEVDAPNDGVSGAQGEVRDRRSNQMPLNRVDQHESTTRSAWSRGTCGSSTIPGSVQHSISFCQTLGVRFAHEFCIENS